jgi:hypothetical protein
LAFAGSCAALAAVALTALVSAVLAGFALDIFVTAAFVGLALDISGCFVAVFATGFASALVLAGCFFTAEVAALLFALAAGFAWDLAGGVGDFAGVFALEVSFLAIFLLDQI